VELEAADRVVHCIGHEEESSGGCGIEGRGIAERVKRIGGGDGGGRVGELPGVAVAIDEEISDRAAGIDLGQDAGTENVGGVKGGAGEGGGGGRPFFDGFGVASGVGAVDEVKSGCSAGGFLDAVTGVAVDVGGEGGVAFVGDFGEAIADIVEVFL